VAREGTDRIGGIDVHVTRLDKLFFPDDGITKGDLIEYYRSVADSMVPYLKDRPLVIGRYPDGITGQGIVQKNVSSYFPEWVSRAAVPKQHGGSGRSVFGAGPSRGSGRDDAGLGGTRR
jgi:bifunctional non-homologous end joining protein LigD